MPSYTDDFGPFDGHVWLNCAHQGPLPRISIAQAHEAIQWKRTPFELTTDRFSGTPLRLKRAIARLIKADASEIILGNSASYGLHLLANGLPLVGGDEVLLTHEDFPSVIYPWLGLEKKGVRVRFVEPRRDVVSPEELMDAIRPSTRVFCTTWVHSFSGRAINLDAIGKVCRDRGVLFIANTSQGLGARTLDVSTSPVDAIVNVGHKWLCGPYGTGFCWMPDHLLQQLTYNQAYWLSLQTADDLGQASNDMDVLSRPKTSRTYDVFGTANFFNYVPWTASIEYLLSQDPPIIMAHNEALIDFLVDHLDTKQYHLLSPASGATRSTLTLVSHKDRDKNQHIYQQLKDQHIHLAYRRGNLRISPHLYNTKKDIEKLLNVLHTM